MENINTWIQKYPDWDMERRSKVTGATVLSSAVYLGQNKLATIHRLLKAGAKIKTLNFSGASYLMLACSNEDADPTVLRFLLQNSDCQSHRVNLRMISQTILWRARRFVCKWAIRVGFTKSRLLQRVAESGGLTSLHYAARRGDMEIVELLLEHGAKPSIKNDLGRDVLS